MGGSCSDSRSNRAQLSRPTVRSWTSHRMSSMRAMSPIGTKALPQNQTLHVLSTRREGGAAGADHGIEIEIKYRW